MSRTVVLSKQPGRYQPSALGSFQTITPNPRAAKALGAPFLSLDTWARREIGHLGLLVASPLAQLRYLRDAVNEVLQPADLAGTARSLSGIVQEILRSGSALSHEADVSARASQVFEVVEAYRYLVRDQQLIDPAESLWLAAEGLLEPIKVLVTGYPRIGAAEVAFLAARAAEGSVLVLPEHASACFDLNRYTAEALERLGWSCEYHEAEPVSLGERAFMRFGGGKEDTSGAPLSSKVNALSFPSREAEVRGVLTRAKALLHQGVSPETIVLVARDDRAYGPLIRDVAWEYEIPLRASYALAIKHTRVGAWLELLIDVLRGNFPFEATARLLAHRLCARLEPERWHEVRQTRPRSFGAWREAVPILECLDWPESALPSEYGARLGAALESLGAAERARMSARETLAFHKLQNALPLLEGDAAISLHAFLSELRELLGLLTVPVNPAARGIELHTPLAIFGARYDHVFVLGLAEGWLPLTVRDDPVLDFHERERLSRGGVKLESALEAVHREQLSFFALLQAVETGLTLSYPLVANNKPLIASPYFHALGLIPTPASTKTPACIEEWRWASLRQAAVSDEVILQAKRAWDVELRREGEAPQDHFDGVVGAACDPASRTFSATQLVMLGQCPFRWFAGYLLGLAEPEEADDDLNPSLRGTLYHEVLEQALTRARGSPDIQQAALARLEEAFAAAEQRVNVSHLPNWMQQREEHLKVLRRALSAPDFFPPQADIVLLEHSFTGTWFGLKVTGKIDRIDRSSDGLVLTDYKTSGSKPKGAKDSRGQAKLDVQVPLYVQVAAPEVFPGEPVAQARYYSLTQAKALPDVTVDQAELEALAERVKTHLNAGSYPVDPDAAGHACSYCEYDLLCRKGPRLERKRAGGDT